MVVSVDGAAADISCRFSEYLEDAFDGAELFLSGIVS